MTGEPSKSGIVSDIVTYGSNAGALAVIFSSHPVSATMLALWASKPVRESISRLISGSLEIPEAWLRNRKLYIEAQGLSEQAALKGFAEKVAETTSSAGTITERAEHYALTVIERKQEARENISQRTLEYLADEKLSDKASAPSEDFMRSFEAVAEKTSSAELQDMMARILAGEIRNPGSISRASLEISNILDKEIIESMLFIKPYIISNKWICVDSLDFYTLNNHCELLSSVRITSEMGIRKHGFSPDGIAVHSFSSGDVLIQANQRGKNINSKFSLQTSGFNVTKSGLELIALLPEKKDFDIGEVARAYEKNEYIERAITGKLVKEGDNFQFIQHSNN